MPGPPRIYATNAARQRAYRERCQSASRTAGDAERSPAARESPTQRGPTRWRRLAQQARDLLGTVHAEMQSYYDHRSETWREGERGEGFLERLEALQEARETVNDLEL